MFTQSYNPVGYNVGNGTFRRYSSGGNYSMSPGQTQTHAMPPQVPVGSPMTSSGTAVPTQTPVFEQSFIENILRLNLGKIGTFYMTYENNSEWNAKIFKGKLEAAGRDHIIISDPNTGVRTILLMVNLDYATFDEPLQYSYPYATGSVPSTRGCC
ncbi:spore coat protein GerQ [Paenibacillus sp. D2_2]|uniref:spore coat protein GerQ n=1 Tax=Paenibacillus sp. D2_2 TaxID=3073092 RepID=UPI00281576DC|nr:spore coat protein GerQ [Paenibacillus sp. D2_2]WMT42985.1 spore coat protein GerQ [Paenibacillus sp. D2_2]